MNKPWNRRRIHEGISKPDFPVAEAVRRPCGIFKDQFFFLKDHIRPDLSVKIPMKVEERSRGCEDGRVYRRSIPLMLQITS